MNNVVFGLTPRTKSEDELAAEGWTRRFVGGPPRLNEMLQMYKELGFEIWLEPQAQEEFAEECADCTLALMLFRVIYTRPMQQASG
ncbi:MAG: hypothetical protein EYC68_21735 [Chloroflexota bacterium]|nr:MAG: hypothetical protein EYC68_21735 [Chloroflexota bacterium]